MKPETKAENKGPVNKGEKEVSAPSPKKDGDSSLPASKAAVSDNYLNLHKMSYGSSSMSCFCKSDELLLNCNTSCKLLEFIRFN